MLSFGIHTSERLSLPGGTTSFVETSIGDDVTVVSVGIRNEGNAANLYVSQLFVNARNAAYTQVTNRSDTVGVVFTVVLVYQFEGEAPVLEPTLKVTQERLAPA